VRSYALLARDSPPSNRMEGGAGSKFKSCTIKIPTSIFLLCTQLHSFMILRISAHFFTVLMYASPESRMVAVVSR
jgi:hypothetical protein